MPLFDNAPRKELERLLPSRVSKAAELRREWAGGALSCRSGFQVPLATKADIALLLTASLDGEYHRISSSGALPRARLLEGLTRCSQTTITVETDDRIGNAQLLQEFHDPGAREAFLFRWSADLFPHLEALAGRALPEMEKFHG